MYASMLTEAPKPGHLFDRDAEWRGLVSFAEVTSVERLVAVRDSNQGGRGSLLEFTETAWRRFVATTKSGKLAPHEFPRD